MEFFKIVGAIGGVVFIIGALALIAAVVLYVMATANGKNPFL